MCPRQQSGRSTQESSQSPFQIVDASFGIIALTTQTLFYTVVNLCSANLEQMDDVSVAEPVGIGTNGFATRQLKIADALVQPSA